MTQYLFNVTDPDGNAKMIVVSAVDDNTAMASFNLNAAPQGYTVGDFAPLADGDWNTVWNSPDLAMVIS